MAWFAPRLTAHVTFNLLTNGNVIVAKLVQAIKARDRDI